MEIKHLAYVLVWVGVVALGLRPAPVEATNYLNFTGPWRTDPALPTAVAEAASATNQITGDIYVIGGYDAANTTVDSLQMYSPTDRAWSLLQPLPTPVRGAAAAYADNQIFVFGGLASTGVQPLLQIYNTNTNSWTSTGFAAGTEGSTAVSAGGLIYVVGGSGQGTTVTQFDPLTMASTTLNSQLYSTEYQGAGFVGNKLFEYGGNSNGGAVTTVNAYDPAAHSWALVNVMGYSRAYLASGSLQNNLLAAGGIDSSGTPLNTFETYSPIANIWYFGQPSLPEAVSQSVGAVSGNSFYVIGGLNAGTVSSYVYQITATPEPAMLPPLLAGLVLLALRRRGYMAGPHRNA